MTGSTLSLADGLRLSGLSYSDLWYRCLALGGMGTAEDVRLHVEGDECPNTHEHNVIAQALNDVFTGRNQDHPVAYRHLSRPGR